MPEQALTLISAFMEDVHQGHSLCNAHNPSDKTIHGYMTSAAEAWRVLTGMMVLLYEDPKDSKFAKLKPIVADILSQHRKWKPTKQKREPYTFEMFKALNNLLCQSIVSNGPLYLQEQWAILDRTCLGIFTRSRLAEYGLCLQWGHALHIPVNGLALLLPSFVMISLSMMTNLFRFPRLM
jgi:hypothetical protein